MFAVGALYCRLLNEGTNIMKYRTGISDSYSSISALNFLGKNTRFASSRNLFSRQHFFVLCILKLVRDKQHLSLVRLRVR